MKLLPRVLTFAPPGEVLAVPESAVVDTGTRKVVYVERGPGMFDGVEVTLGARCGEFFPVAKGLEAGQRVATAGSFLIDAETRLNPSAALSYFGAGSSSASSAAGKEVAATQRAAAAPASKIEPSAGTSAVPKPRAKLSAADEALVAKQMVCPVSGEPLGSMGVPVRAVVSGKTVFLCCAGC